jgi:hypothetical protein
MLGEIVSAGLDFLGQSQTNQKSWDIAMANNQASAEQAQKQMDFQERMRKTQYQTTVEDLKAAGLNPMLAYTQGGAGTPAGAMGTVHTPQFKSPLSSARAAALETANILADVTKKEAETTESTSRTGVNNEQSKLIQAQTLLAILEQPNVSQKTKNMISEMLLNDARRTATSAQEAASQAQALLYGAQTGTAGAHTALLNAQTAKTGKETDILTPNADMSKSGFGKILPYAKEGIGLIGSAVDAVTSWKPRPRTTIHKKGN